MSNQQGFDSLETAAIMGGLYGDGFMETDLLE